MPRLRTYVHISDLHFGSPLLSGLADPWLRYVPLLNGFVGEDPAALKYLGHALDALRRAEPDTELIVTGDLTAFGADSQFDRANDYLGQRGQQPPFLGLDFPRWRELAVPGNHDHWPGIPYVSLGGNSAAVRSRFPDSYVSQPVDLGHGRQLVFIHLDGDIDVGPWSPERYYAIGSFVSGLDQLDLNPKLAGPPPGNQVRVMLLHYSVQYVGAVISSRWVPVTLSMRHLSIDKASRDALTKFARKHDVRVLLSGHVHNPFFVGDVPELALRSGPGMEARCGSSSQRIAPLPVGGHGKGKRIMNSFIVHRVEEDDAGTALFWNSEVHAIQLSGVGGFQPARNFVSRPAPDHRVQVWP